MKKSALIIILTIVLVASCLALTACHECEFGAWTVATPATCTQDGLEQRVCECGEIETRAIPATGHTFEEWTVTKQPTCTELGQEQRVCACGEKEVRDISLAKHTYGEWTEMKAPTCTETGLSLRFCACGATETKVIDATGHSHEAIVTEPTCTKQGYTTHTCHCGDSYVDTYVDSTGHTEGSAIVENNVDPTCTVDGSYDNVVYCTVCDAELSRDTVTVDALGHDEQQHQAQAPTCTEIGWDAYVTCSRCDYSTYNEIPATGHTDGEWITDVEPTCTVEGSKHQVCATCGATIKTESIEAFGHTYESVVTQPTCTAQGYTTHTCSVCGDSYVDRYVDALGHNFQESDACSNCGQKIADVAVATYDMSATTDDNVKGYVVARPDSYYDAYIKGAGVMKDYMSSNSPFHVDDYTIINAYIGNGVTSIGYGTFSACRSLVSVVIPNSVTSIGTDAFRTASKLRSIIIAGNITSIGSNAFWNTAYYSNESNWQNKVLYIGNCLIEAKATIETCTIKEGTTVIAQSAFSGCVSLESITIPSSVIGIGKHAFYNCTSLTSITIPNSVTTIGDCAFESCESLTSVTIGNSVISIGKYAFLNCTNLISITIPNSVTTIGGFAFNNCSSLTSVTIGNSVTSIGYYAFYNCYSLTTVYYPGTEEQWNNIEIGSSNSCLTSATIVFNHPDHNYVAEVTAPTCTEQGYTAHACHCGDSYVDTYTEATGHDYSSVVTAPTCLEQGYTTHTCHCGDSYVADYVDALSHTEVVDAAVAATCTATGLTEGKHCSVCNEVLTAQTVVDALGHKYESVVTAPTCTAQGYTTYTCHCGDSYVADYVDALGHNYVEGVCTVCGYRISLGLSYTLSDDGDSYIVSGIGDCTDTDVVIPATYEGKPVKEIGKNAFLNCTNLEYITIPSSVTNIGQQAFLYCTSLASITITEGVTSIGDSAFYGCTRLTSVTLSEGVTSIGKQAFNNCRSLTGITMPSSLTSIGDFAFYGCTSLSRIDVSENNTKYKSVDGDVYSKDGTILIQYAIGKTATSFAIPDSVTSIGTGAFMSGTKLKNITIPSSVLSIGDYAFNACTSLTSVTISEGVTSIGEWSFEGCTSLKSITIPSSLISIGYHAFYDCPLEYYVENGAYYLGNDDNKYHVLVWVVLNTDTSYSINQNTKIIGEDAFSYYYNTHTCLTSVTIPEGVTHIGYGAFSNCTKLTGITIPASVVSIDANAFSWCTSLSRIDVSENNTKYKSVDGNVYSKNGTILIKYAPGKVNTSFTIPSYVTSIGEGAFEDCTNLTNIIIPDGVTTIGRIAFFYCTSLESITIPSSVTNIGNQAFDGCSNLSNVYYEGTQAQWNAISMGYYNDYLTNANIVFNHPDHNYVAEVTAPTCTKQGYTTHICNICNDSYIDTYVDALGHDEIAHEAKEPTCTEIGWDAYVTCSRCDYTTCSEISATGHNYESVETLPTCTEEGYIAYTCHCGDSYVDVTAPWEHQYESFITEPTCTEQGYTYYSCNFCGDSYEDDYIDALGHDLIEYAAQEPTCTEIGWDAYVTCSRCDYTTYVEIAIGHNFQESDTCANCGQNIADVAVASYNMSATSDDNVKGYVVARPTGNYDAYIKGAGAMKDYTASTAPFRVDGYTILYAYIENGITSIGSRAFTNAGLINITIPDSVTTIGDYAIFNNTKLTDLIIPNGVISIGELAFWGCDSLVSVTIPSSVISIANGVFSGCNRLSSITIEGSPQIGENAFWGTAYYDNANNWENKVLYIDNCLIEAKTTIETCTIKEGTMVIADSAFYDCISLTEITIPSSVTSIGQKAFYNCSSLTNVYFAGTVEQWYSISIDSSNDDCLSNVTIIFNYTGEDNENTYSVGLEYEAWADIVMATIGGYVVSGIGTCTDSDIIIPSTYEGKPVTDILDRAFESNANLTSVAIPDSVESIGAYAFSGCENLKSVTFGNNSQLVSIDEGAFYNCKSLTSIEIPNGVTSIGSDAFRYCTSLSSITLPFVGAELNGTENTHFGYIFGASSYSSNNSYVPTSLKTVIVTGSSIGSYAFVYCHNLTSITISEGVNSLGRYAIWSCSNLTSVTFEDPDGWYVTQTEGATSGTTLTLTNPTDNVDYFTTYRDYYWYKD